jgi:hypothetical protein
MNECVGLLWFHSLGIAPALQSWLSLNLLFYNMTQFINLRRHSGSCTRNAIILQHIVPASVRYSVVSG